MENAQTDNSAACGQSRSTAGLERMFRVAKTDHPDLVGGIVWSDCELKWINERILLAILAEREACASACEALWQEEATAAANGNQNPKYHDCIECAYAIRERSNAELRGRPLADGPA